MKMFVEPADIYLYMDVVDFRKSINGLIVVVEQDMNLNPFRDALFVFCNKKRDKVKILYWDKTGFALWYKQLEKHRFKWPCRNINEEKCKTGSTYSSSKSKADSLR